MEKHEIIKAKKIAKLQGQLKALRHIELKVNADIVDVFNELEKYGQEMHPENFPETLVTQKIKMWLKGEISDYHTNDQDADVDSRELGILDGRYECARSLVTQIKKWENGYE